MTQNWPTQPHFKIMVGGTTYIDDQALSIQVTRPENNVSFAVLTVNDYKSKNFVDVFDSLSQLQILLYYEGGTGHYVFSGAIGTVSPRLSFKGEVLDVLAWGQGNAFVKTCCDESYGVESIDNSAVDTPKEIVEDIIDEHVNKIFGVAAPRNWVIGKTEIEDVHNGLSVTFLNSQYQNNFVNVNRVCELTNAYAQGLGAPEVSVHWYVDPNRNFYLKKIDADHVAVDPTAGRWDHYWGGMSETAPGTQASSTIEVAEDMILYDFRKNVEEYANHILLSTKWRMPGEDYWTEDNGGQVLWGSDGNVTLADSATSIVGSHSLSAQPNAGAITDYWYPAGKTAGWDLTKCGSQKTVPTLNMWLRKNKALGAVTLGLHTDAANHYRVYTSIDNFIPTSNEWAFASFPVGPYFNINQDPLAKCRWDVTASGGAESWANINWIQVSLPGDNTIILYIDDLHFSGTIVREAKDTAEITANRTYMKVIRNDTAVNDVLVAATDTGTAARLAYAELLRRSQTPIVGKIRVPMAPYLLPGQTVHIHACKQASGSFRIDQDFRVKEVVHMVQLPHGYTELNLTSDVTNTHAFAVPDQYSLLMEYAGALGHSEARDLKGGALDNLIPRLTKSY